MIVHLMVILFTIICHRLFQPPPPPPKPQRVSNLKLVGEVVTCIFLATTLASDPCTVQIS